MDGSRFDRWTRALIGNPSRRGALRLLAGGAVAAAWQNGLDPVAAVDCPRGRRRCGRKCCRRGQVCVNGGCFGRCQVTAAGGGGPAPTECGGLDGCGCVTLDSGKTVCAFAGGDYCRDLPVCQDDSECPKGQVCARGGRTCPDHKVCLPPCRCPAGWERCGTAESARCCEEGQFCCGGQNCCHDSQRCCSDGRCSNNVCTGSEFRFDDAICGYVCDATGKPTCPRFGCDCCPAEQECCGERVASWSSTPPQCGTLPKGSCAARSECCGQNAHPNHRTDCQNNRCCYVSPAFHDGDCTACCSGVCSGNRCCQPAGASCQGSDCCSPLVCTNNICATAP